MPRGETKLSPRSTDACDAVAGSSVTLASRYISLLFPSPFCQVSIGPSSLPAHPREPPAYIHTSLTGSSQTDAANSDDQPPPYTLSTARQEGKKSSSSPECGEDVLHFVHPRLDTLRSLALRYRVPVDALRRSNALYSDHLLPARKTVLIPGEYYKGGVSLSPIPHEGEEEELRKAKVRRWMVACKVVDYDMALIYLDQAHYDLDGAINAYLADDQWEKDNPVYASSNGSHGASGLSRK